MGILSAAVAAAATAALERAAEKLPKENREPFERTNHRGESVTLLEGPVAVLGALAGVAASRGNGKVKAAAVVAGTPETAQNGGLLKALRSDSEATKIVSSVDVADIPSGRMTVVFALVEQATGKAGQYGAMDAKNGVAPSAVQTKDN